MKLPIELVPQPLWGKSLKKTLKRSEWDRLRRWALDRAGNTCSPCGTVIGGGAKMVCHEVWVYDEDRAVQTLTGVEIHCPDCDRVTHIGFTGRVLPRALPLAEARLEQVNGWTREQAEVYRQEVRQRWHERSAMDWTQDLSWYERWKVEHHLAS